MTTQGDRVRRVALVSGHVQGVGYRWFVARRAEAAGLAGTARNLSDGRVEVALEGPSGAVDAVVAALTGPDAPGAPAAVDVRDAAVEGTRGFTTA